MINSFTYDTDFGKITICEKDNFIIETVIGISSFKADRIIESPMIRKAHTK
ncbi:cysteine methyltransferase, partial [Clostridium butyricum]|nr:cysteine methyltransferase [Clostridium butyricum]